MNVQSVALFLIDGDMGLRCVQKQKEKRKHEGNAMNATCYPRNDLAQFVQGQLASERLSEIADHVDSCESCQDTVVALADNEDTFAVALRDAQSDGPFEGEAALRQGLRRMVASMKKPQARSGEQTSAYVRQVGPYTLEESLGTGGMGTVYRAVHSKLKRDVAVKLLPAARWSNATAISRFEREMEAIGQLDHPNIVRASDAGEDKGMHYLVMDYVDGLDLSRLTRRLGPLPVADACELARQAAAGLQYAHDNGLIHRDIKPSNLMLAHNRGRTGEPTATLRVLDLGLALLGDEHLQDAGELTSVGQLMGTLDYMSPEQGIDSHGVDHRTDIYGLGATLFKLLTGRAPYADPRFGTLMKKMTALATKTAPSVAEFRGDLPAELVAIVDRMLARDPDERFGAAEEVAAALAPFAKTSDLTALLKSGLDTDEPEQTPVVIAPSFPRLDANEEVRAPKSKTDSSGGGQSGSWWKYLAAAGSMALAAIAFYISTDYGDVVFYCDDPNAGVSVRRADGNVTAIKVQNHKGKQRVRAGEYVVEIEGDATSYEINPQDFDLKRQKTVKVSVTRKGGKAKDPMVAKGFRKPAAESRNAGGIPFGRSSADAIGLNDTDPYGAPADAIARPRDGNPFGAPAAEQVKSVDPFAVVKQSGPTYGGGSFNFWADDAATSRDIDDLKHSFEAMAVLADDAEMQRRAAELICKSMRVHGGVHFEENVTYEGGRHALIVSGIAAVLRMGPDATIDVLARETKEGNVKSKEFVRMLTALDFPFQQNPDRNELRRFRAGLVKNKEKFAAGMVPPAREVTLTFSDGVVFSDVYGNAVANEFREMLSGKDIELMQSYIQLCVVGKLDSAGDAFLKSLQNSTEKVTVKRTSMDAHMIFEQADFEGRLQRASQVIGDRGYDVARVLGQRYFDIRHLAAGVVHREMQCDARIKSIGREDGEIRKWRDSTVRMRKEISRLEEHLAKKVAVVLAEDFDPNVLKQMAVETNREENPDAFGGGGGLGGGGMF